VGLLKNMSLNPSIHATEGCVIGCSTCLDQCTPCDFCKKRIHEAWHKVGVPNVWFSFCTGICKEMNFEAENRELERFRNSRVPREKRVYKKIKNEVIPL